jgi:hypothetical protein
MFLPAGRTGIESLAAAKFHTRNDEMQLVMIRVTMPHPKDIALIRLQARESHLFKVIHDALFLFRLYRIVRMPGENPGGEFPLGVQRVDEGAGGLHIPAQHFRRQLVAARIVRAHKVMRGAVTATLAVRKNLHVHGVTSEPGAAGRGVSCNSRSRLTSAVSTSIASARLLWMFTHRASWFRFAPMRASWRTRSFSRGVCRSR